MSMTMTRPKKLKLDPTKKRPSTFDRSAHMKALWSNPEYRARQTAANRKRKPFGYHPHPGQSAAISACWADPVYRAKRAEGTKRMCADRAANPDKYSRVMIPNGMRRAEAMAAWEVAGMLADEAMRQLQARGDLPAVTVPDSDDALANQAIREAFKMALGPGSLGDKLDALRVVLRYTKALPPAVAHTLITRHGAGHDQTGLLRAMLAEMGAPTSDDRTP
jgi:hypothetical protein